MLRHFIESGQQGVTPCVVSKQRWLVATLVSLAFLAACGAKSAEGVRQDKIDAFENELILGGPPDRVRDTDRSADPALEAEYREGEQDGYFVGSDAGLLAGRAGEDCDDMDVHELSDPKLGYDAGKTDGYSEGYAEACARGYDEFSAEQTQQEEDQ